MQSTPGIQFEATPRAKAQRQYVTQIRKLGHQILEWDLGPIWTLESIARCQAKLETNTEELRFCFNSLISLKEDANGKA